MEPDFKGGCVWHNFSGVRQATGAYGRKYPSYWRFVMDLLLALAVMIYIVWDLVKLNSPRQELAEHQRRNIIEYNIHEKKLDSFQSKVLRLFTRDRSLEEICEELGLEPGSRKVLNELIIFNNMKIIRVYKSNELEYYSLIID